MALFETADPEIVAPTVTEPTSVPVKVAVYTPDPALVTEPNDPVPAPLRVKRIDPTAGRPDGFVFPAASFAVNVTVMPDPEFTLEADAVTTLWPRL